MQKWLSIVGIGEDGLDGISALARSHIQSATVLVGGERHLAMLPIGDRRTQITWASPIEKTLPNILKYRGQPVCVLASGDPLCYGIGVTLLRSLPLAEMTILPAPSAFSLAAARLGWALADVETLSLCGRDPTFLNGLLYSTARVLVLSGDHTTPLQVAKLLSERGYGESILHIFERMGGDQERYHCDRAANWSRTDISPLNMMAIECSDLAPGYPQPRSRLAGLPDEVYLHDGQLTKQDVRAITLAALNPLPGQLLWDVGAGCGSISIEWLRSDRRCRAIAIEQNPSRTEYLRQNAATLGTPNLQIVAGSAPEALAALPPPDAVFIGGGFTTPQLFETCWQALKPGGMFVTNAVTLASEQLIYSLQQEYGGDLTRIMIQRATAIGTVVGWRALAPVTQWVVQKPMVLF
jgi:precorrin-6B C5,15-methyltransferase / cobalt-precorrin-6B C5,C15-methyltransferase